MAFMTDDFDGFNDSEDFDEINNIDRSKTFSFSFQVLCSRVSYLCVVATRRRVVGL